MAIRALIFDFDGVVIDTETPDFVMWQGVFDDHGVSLDRWLWETFIGAGMGSFDVSQHLEEMVGRSIDRDKISTDRRARYLSAVEANPVLPGVTDLVSGVRAAGLKLGVASSSRRDWVEGHLARRGLLDYFDAVRCRDDVSAAKPDPELYTSALAALGVEPESAIAIEDSANGVTAAKRAGMFCVVVPNAMTSSMRLDHADLRLQSLADVSLDDLIEAADGR
jgi:HAD superfamily hydrolase (TIGR01509 family)